MRYQKYGNFYRCIYFSPLTVCLLGLEFNNNEQSQIDFAIHHLDTGKSVLTDSNDVLMQVMDAAKEKELEYNRPFFMKSIEYVDNDYVHDLKEYYRLAQRIIDRIMNFPGYDGHS